MLVPPAGVAPNPSVPELTSIVPPVLLKAIFAISVVPVPPDFISVPLLNTPGGVPGPP